jgi:hypothetical protein
MAQSAEASLKASMKKAPVAGVPTAGQPLKQQPLKTSEAMQLQLDALRTRYGEAYPDVKRLKNDLAWVQRLEAEQEAKAKAQQAAESDANDGESARVQKAARSETAKASQPAAQPVPTAGAEGSDAGKAQKTPEAQKGEQPQSAEVAPPELLQTHQQIGTIQTQLELIRKDIETRTAERQAILREIAGYEGRINKLPIREQEMAQIMRDYEISKANYQSLLEKKNAAEMASDMERREKAERFEMLDPARVPEKPFSPNRPLLGGIGCALSVMLGLALAFGKEMKSDVLLGEWELPVGYAVLSRVPRIDMLKAGAEADAQSGDASSQGNKGRKWRLALVSAALSLLAVVALGIYFVMHRL